MTGAEVVAVGAGPEGLAEEGLALGTSKAVEVRRTAGMGMVLVAVVAEAVVDVASGTQEAVASSSCQRRRSPRQSESFL